MFPWGMQVDTRSYAKEMSIAAIDGNIDIASGQSVSNTQVSVEHQTGTVPPETQPSIKMSSCGRVIRKPSVTLMSKFFFVQFCK